MSDFHDKMFQGGYPESAGENDEYFAALRRDRRERIATACLAAILASATTGDHARGYVKSAIAYADKLIDMLDAPEGK